VVVQRLLEKQVDMEIQDNDGWTALMWAARNGHEGVVQRLLENQVDMEKQDNDGWTALMRAAWKGHEGVVQMLQAVGMKSDGVGYD
jgi:ankyrin repeat protein